MTLLLNSEVTYTTSLPGLVATALAPLSSIPVVQPASGLSTMQPLSSPAWVRAPVEGSRVSTARALESAEAA